ncbi:5575_t:CDS:2 [Funneliformis mosseae]|uniref:5575_t:CDS:1 n=1 Tax=Funneliformis mosseae TaxID=27381 RepID=A0A9N9CH31_FUNMO|nr:5575_t:CDS:2 [Funneliformis mosseae]
MLRQQNTMAQFDFATAAPQENELKQLKVVTTYSAIESIESSDSVAINVDTTYSAVESSDSVAFKRRHGF